jgi:rare lipoprotein A (peptidoglycan hydrolase)
MKDDRIFNVLQTTTLLCLFFAVGWLWISRPNHAAKTSFGGGDGKLLTAPVSSTPAPSASVRPETGIASWYGPGYQGKMTAGGFCFDMHRHTLACNHLPFGTVVRVTNPKTGKSCIGMVTDRGPSIPGRKYDVSYSMAKQLGMVRDGLAKVTVEILL